MSEGDVKSAPPQNKSGVSAGSERIHRTDFELRSTLLKWFYDHRKEGFALFGPSTFPDLEPQEIDRICDQLQSKRWILWQRSNSGRMIEDFLDQFSEQGVVREIPWVARPGPGVGAGKVTALGSDEAERLLEPSQPSPDPTYGQLVNTNIIELLTGLSGKIPDIAEREYYKEALICYKHGSPRAAVVMTWNIAFSHLCHHVLAKRLVDFNNRWPFSFPGMHKNQPKTITTFDDFSEHLKESEVLTICRDAGIISKNIYNIMHASLGKRNAAAHPNSLVIGKVQADAFIQDLIVNVVQKIA